MGHWLSPVGDFCSRAFAFSTVQHLPTAPDSPEHFSVDPTVEGADELCSWLNGVTAEQAPVAGPIRSHLSRSRHVVGLQLTIGKSQLGQRTLPLKDALIAWAHAANVIWVTEDQRVLDPEGRLLLDIHGQGPDRDAVIPFPLDARRRKSEMEMRLRNRMVDPPAGLLPIPGADEIQNISPSDVARRAIALFLCATRAESILAGQPLDVQRMRARSPIGFAAMTAQERAFFDLPDTEPVQAQRMQSAIDFVWRYESLMALQWALDMQFDLPWPDEHADLTSVTRLMIDLPDESIVEHARLRASTEILDAAELHYQAMQSIVDAQNAGRELSGVLDTGVVCERLIALSWINGFAPSPPDWDRAVQWVEFW